MTDWQSSLCCVCFDCSRPACPCCITCCACLAPCIIYGKTSGLSNWACCGPCCFYCVVGGMGLGCCLGMAHRFRVGLSYDIYHDFDCGTCCCVCLASLLCSACSLAQIYVQVNSDPKDPKRVKGGECIGIVDAPHTYNHFDDGEHPAPTKNETKKNEKKS